MIIGPACGVETNPRAATKLETPAFAFDESEVDAQATTLAKSPTANSAGILKTLGAMTFPADNTNAIVAVRALILLKATDVDAALIKLAKTSELPELSQECWKALGKLAAPTSIPDMLYVLDTPRDIKFRHLVTQVAAMTALAEIARREFGSETFIEQFERMASQVSPTAKLRMIELLQNFDTPGSRRMLFEFTGDSNRDVQRCALSAIVRAENPQSISTLQSLLSSTDVLVRKEAILALGRCKGLAAMPALTELLDSKDAGTKANAKWALQNITGREFTSAVDAKLWLESEKVNSDNRFITLKEQMKTGAPKLLPLAVEELGKLVLIQDKLAAELHPYLEHTDFRVRAAACDALGKTAPATKTYGLLIARMLDGSDVVRATAWRVMQRSTGQKLPNDHAAWAEWLRKRG